MGVQITMAILGILVCLVIIGSVSAVFLAHDNPIEEACEEIIKEKTGVDIDITPDSPEKKDSHGHKDKD